MHAEYSVDWNSQTLASKLAASVLTVKGDFSAADPGVLRDALSMGFRVSPEAVEATSSQVTITAPRGVFARFADYSRVFESFVFEAVVLSSSLGKNSPI